MKHMNTTSKIQAITNIGSNQGKPVNSCPYIVITAPCFPPPAQSPRLLHYFPRLYFERILYQFRDFIRQNSKITHVGAAQYGSRRAILKFLSEGIPGTCVSPFAENDRETKREIARWRGTVFRWPVAGTPHASNMQIARLKRTYTMTEMLGQGCTRDRGLVGREGEGGSNVRNYTRRL